MKLAWATDVHLNFVSDSETARFCERIAQSEAEALLLGGDIGEAADLEGTLALLATTLRRPIYFVLGNHDYYGSDVQTVRDSVRALTSPWLHWLPATDVVPLTPDTALIGHGGWGDARAGDFDGSTAVLSDYLLIGDLREATPGHAENPTAILDDKPALASVMRALGDDAATTVAPLLRHAAAASRRVLFLTHVPPFPEACWHQGKISHEHWLPMFTCQAVGNVLRETALDHPSSEFTVLCGHTHGSGQARILRNLMTYTRAAEYGRPIFLLLDLDEDDFGLSRHDWTQVD